MLGNAAPNDMVTGLTMGYIGSICLCIAIVIFVKYKKYMVYIIYTMFVLYGTLPRLFEVKPISCFSFVILINVTITWLIFSITWLVKKLYYWTVEDQDKSIKDRDNSANLMLAKLTFIWGIVATILGILK
ncbi:hypothetical protein [Lactobacillus sp. ESL0681]|uniref:hypothetical protein n=1 Tax=Lactobacillus sp. ESL0681 TaxID=2983211 RepID=UPI0023F92312|nr:hypothetical protein [Lactobacillus sp. ESL0681]WEV41314.1 hypothetical protein OZX59_09295 [Lactobacillus sp. ESL0681]